MIWAIGASMVVLAGAQFLGQRACLVIGGAILVGHNLLDPIWPATSGVFDIGHPLWVALHAQMAIAVGPFFFAFVYPLLPWPGVMLLGYGTARLFQEPAEARRAAPRLGHGGDGGVCRAQRRPASTATPIRGGCRPRRSRRSSTS